MEEQPAISASEEKIKALTAQGTQCLQLGQHHEALIHFQSSLNLTELIDKPRLKLACLLNAGAALVTTGEHQRGISLLQSALTLLDSIPNHESRTETHSPNKEGPIPNGQETANTEIHSSNQEDSIPNHHENETSSWSPDHTRGDIYFNLGLANEGIREISLAITQLKQSVDYYIKSGQTVIAGDVFCTLSSCYRDHKHHKQQQITALLSAQTLYHDAGDQAKEIMTYTELAIAYQLLGKREECIQMLTTAKIMGLRLDDVRTQGKYMSGVE